MNTFKTTIYKKDGSCIELEGQNTLDDAMAHIHSDYIVQRNPKINMGWWWNLQFNANGIPNFFSFNCPSRPITDEEYKVYSEICKKDGIEAAPQDVINETDWARLEKYYSTPNGMIKAIHISARCQ